MTSNSNSKMHIEAAHFKFALIAPVIQGIFPDATKTAYYRRVTENPLILPNGQAVTYNYNTLEKWESRYRYGGMDALLPAVRQDKGLTRTLSDTAIEEIYRLKEKFPRLNSTQVYHRLIQEALIPATVSVASIQRFVKRNDLKSARNLNMKDRKAFEEEFFGGMWQADTCYLPYINEKGKKRRTFLIMIIDDHSRLIVGAEIFYNDNAYNFQKVLKAAVMTYGIPYKLYLDNGSSYSNDQLTLISGSLGIVKLHTPVRDGAAKGKVERGFRTMKERWLYGLDVAQIQSLEEFNQLLASYVRKYNTSLHSSIKMTPHERFLLSSKRVRKPKSIQWLCESFMNRIPRKVNNDATISIDAVYYDAPMQFIGMKVDVRFLPDEMNNAYILYEGKHYELRLTNKVENSKTKREGKIPSIDYAAAGGTPHV